MKPGNGQLEEFGRGLIRSFSGEIRLDSFCRKLCATEASIYQIEPLAVLLPKAHDDVATAITVAFKHGLPILSRGEGTRQAGQTIAAVVAIDYSKHMDRFHEINPEEGRACKTARPANVAVAKPSFEYQARHPASHGTPLCSLFFGNIAQASRIGPAAAAVSNRLPAFLPEQNLIAPRLRIHPDRKMPVLLRKTFQEWLKATPPQSQPAASHKVVLFNDPFTNYNEPGIGISALRFWVNTGAEGHILPIVCCGRPMIPKGLLEQARENAWKNAEIPTPFIGVGA